MKKESINVKGMTCSHCVKAIENELVKLPLRYFTVTKGNVTAEFDELLTGHEEIKQAIVDAGYEIEETIETV
jgi:copper chaperone